MTNRSTYDINGVVRPSADDSPVPTAPHRASGYPQSPLELLAEGSVRLARVTTRADLSRTLVMEVARVTDATDVAIWWRTDGSNGRLELDAFWPERGNRFQKHSRLDWPTGRLAEQAFRTRAPVLGESAGELPGITFSVMTHPLLWAIPLALEGDWIGLIYAVQPRRYDDMGTTATILGAYADQAAHRWQATKVSSAARRDEAEFFAIAAHDLKNVATAIKGYAQLLGRTLNQPPAPRAERAVSVIAKQTDVLVDTLNLLVDVGRLRAGSHRLNREWMDLGEALQKAETALQEAEEATTFVVEPPLEPIQGRWDRGRLVRALTLVLGAARQSAHGSAVLPVAVAVSHDLVQIRVGAADAERDWPGRDDWAGHANASLHLARRLLQAQGGALGLRSRPDGVLLLSVHLPLEHPQDAAP